MTPRWGAKDQVLVTGRMAYVFDGTNAYPLKGNSSGNLEATGVLKEVRVTKNIITGGTYAVGDVISEQVTNGAGTAWTFAEVARVNGGYGYITGAVAISQTPNITPSFALLIFNATPTGELDDNAGNTSPVDADLAKFVGAIEFPSMNPVGTSSNSWAIASPSTTGNLPLPFKCAAAADDLLGILVTRSIFTQVAADNMTVVLLVEQY